MPAPSHRARTSSLQFQLEELGSSPTFTKRRGAQFDANADHSPTMLEPIRDRSPQFLRQSSGKRLRLYYLAPAVLAVILLAAIFTPLPSRYDSYRHSILHKQPAQDTAHAIPAKSGSNNAYAIFLAANTVEDNEEDINADNYFVAARTLIYQILYAAPTRTVKGYDVVVLVTPRVSERKRERLRKDGAIVVEAKLMDTGWVQSTVNSWQSVMLKLRLWELTQYNLITFVDADTVLQKPLDDIFNEAEVKVTKSKPSKTALLPGENPIPKEYVFAASRELNYNHSYPPTVENKDYDLDGKYANAGFFVLKPSQEVFDYYMSLTRVPADAGKNGENLFDPNMPEQNLLNWAHRLDGPMPWKPLRHIWSAHYATYLDAFSGVHSLHAKFWGPAHKDVQPLLEKVRWRMEGYWEGREAASQS